MAYPPTPPPNTRTDSTPLPTNHPADHNDISDALTDIINELGSNPSGDSASVAARFDVVCPIGAVLPYAGGSAPSGWGLCDGSAVSRTTYAELYALVGDAFGAGDGSTTFNLPDLRSRFVAGKGTAGWSDALAETGGSKDAIVPEHAHPMPHTHAVDPPSTTVSGLRKWLNRTTTSGSTDVGLATNETGTGSAADTGATVNITSFASGGVSTPNTSNPTGSVAVDDQNLPPYLVLNHIIRLT